MKLLGVWKNNKILTDKLPFQFNFDILKAINFKKGCYLGQQIISRAYYTGIVRKRIFPFWLEKSENNKSEITQEKIPKDTILYDENNN